MFNRRLIFAGFLVSTIFPLPGDAGEPSATPPRPFARLFVQDSKTCDVRWTDVRLDAQGKFSFEKLTPVPGFPQLDPTKQKLVQMRESQGFLCVGVRDLQGGDFGSGWVLIQSGVTFQDHGDHGHWQFQRKPQVRDQRLDKNQGNPAHLYVYNERFFLANDKRNGYTRIDPVSYLKTKPGSVTKNEPRFLVGGGNHITLAVVDDKVGYSCWIDHEGDCKGKVDVTPILTNGKSIPQYSFFLPTGGIHGAAAAGGKVFFAPADGVCWVEADTGLSKNQDSVNIHHISLGKHGDVPRRTGAFSTVGHHILFTTGKNEDSSLVILNAKHASPQPQFLPLKVQKGNRPLTPIVTTTPEGKSYAFVFHNHSKDVEIDDALDVIALDPDGNGNFSDAQVLKTLKVGRSAVDGHFGHHDLAFDADSRFGFIVNPGDATLSVLSLKTLTIVETIPLSGSPGALVARGAFSPED